jgi:hypothetical protein
MTSPTPEVIQRPRIIILEKNKGFLIKDVYKSSVIKVTVPGSQGPKGDKGDKGADAQVDWISREQIDNLFG